MKDQNECSKVMAALAGVIQNGGSLTDAQRAHLQTCERCKHVLAEAIEIENSLAVDDTREGGVDADAVAREAARITRNRVHTRIVVAFVAFVVFGFLALIPLLDKRLDRSEALMVSATGFGIALLFAAPVIGLMYIARTKDDDKPRLYKRLGPGRKISGVCLGLAEKIGWNVWTIRFLFLLAIFFNGAGFWVYLLLDLTLPVHPADRQYLLRFRIARWFRARRGAEI